MPVYVDEERNRGESAPLRFRWSCHMTASTLFELHAMASRLGLKREYFQDGLYPHYDLTAGKRTRAVLVGAIECHVRDWIRLNWAIRAWVGPWL